MRALFDAMRNDADMTKVISAFSKRNGQTLVYGASDSIKHTIFAMAYDMSPRPFCIVVPDKNGILSWKENLESLLPNAMILEMPEADITTFKVDTKSIDLMAKRMNVLELIRQNKNVIILSTISSAMQKDLKKQDFEKLSLFISTGTLLEREALVAGLVDLGYEHSYEVEHIGQFSTRGGIVDIFPINAVLPVRVEFFDNEVDSIREFSLETHRSINSIDKTSVIPLRISGRVNATEHFFSYFNADGNILFDEPRRLKDSVIKKITEDPEIKKQVFAWEDILESSKKQNVIYSALIPQRVSDVDFSDIIHVSAKNVASYQRQFHLLFDDIDEWIKQKTKLLIFMNGSEKALSMREMLASHRLPSVLLSNPESLSNKTITVSEGRLSNGFELPGASLVVLTDSDIFGQQKKKIYKNTSNEKNKISHFSEINVGDYVVHVNHGIGKYLGVVTLDVGNVKRDYLHIKYGGDDQLFVPTDQVQFLQKYIGAEGETPRLHKMGGTEWARAKTKAKASVEDIAKDLVKLYATRRELHGFAFPPDTPWQNEFEEAFPYEETDDQLKAAEEIKKDMEKEKPMDRLLCGDVGFGKTEVAMRAAFKAVMGGKQVAVLVPTTILAEQHYRTFSERFLNFGPVIDLICRFRTPSEQRKTLKKISEGRVDIVIGTHALLNQRRVHFNNLGLLIVDEEQRFGVKQKEKIKSIASSVDVLTLSATPIPRTLHMSLVGARDMSIIETPPAERYPIQTYVVEANDNILASAIRREMKRGGQIFFVYNRVNTIDKMKERLLSIVPEARIQTAHGQMPEEILESVMMDFYEKKFDVLLATSIVENGLDVQNANTIIIYNADHFGLSQLYQMRGRVGRSQRLAYAYFVYQRDKVLTENAEKRLQTMKDFAELGAGFKIAMRDLEIRGAGNLLGAEQSGHIMSVGFEMYCRLLDEAIYSIKTGKKVEEKPEPVIEINVEAYIDGGYIDDAMHKIEIYQRIAAIRNEKDIESLTAELIDRFGEPTPPVMRLLDVARIKNFARDIGIKTIVDKEASLEIALGENNNISADGIERLSKQFGKNLKILSELMRIKINLPSYAKNDILKFILQILMTIDGNPSN